MTDTHIQHVADELKLAARQVEATVGLLTEGATVPFIARYRKEATGSLDEVAITTIRDRLAQLEELTKRREAILRSLEERGQLTDELQSKLAGAETLAVLEDVYLPYRPKRRTRATIAKEKGLEPLARRLFAQEAFDPVAEAAAFVSAEKGVESADDALAGVRDIIAEWISEEPDARASMRALFQREGALSSKLVAGKETEGAKFRDYFDWREPVAAAPSHRILAMLRGENEGVLVVHAHPPDERALDMLRQRFVKASHAVAEQVRLAVEDGYKRLLKPSMETETLREAKRRADEAAIHVFQQNLRELLLAPPLGGRNVLAIDPGIRTGCKIVCLDRQGKLLHNNVIFLQQSDARTKEAVEKVRRLREQFQIEAIAIGNGTASRETEAFIRRLDLPPRVTIVIVNESGASVYSASEVAREEFPEQDVTVRGAVSIGRRLQDPHAELVNIDPKSIGVGQYQHDVEQGALKSGLDDVVVSCVNSVGVEVNTASRQILGYVSGLGPQLAKNIVEHRNANGPFHSRAALRQVPRMGPKAYEQSAGFLRIRDAENPLDASAVHPESYPIVDAMARDLGCTVADLVRDGQRRAAIRLDRYVTDTVGLPTLTDILAELAKPGRDPREQFEAFQFAEGIEKFEDVKPGMRVPGIVTNVTGFGAFVDIGVHQDGLVHVSQLADRFVKNPADVVKVHQKVMVTVLEIDLERRRIALSMKSAPGKPNAQKPPAAKESRSPEKSRPPKQAAPKSAPPKTPAAKPAAQEGGPADGKDLDMAAALERLKKRFESR